ncbi:MAG: hypothetical protein LBI35_02600 [Burkholderiales bacterium]|jgi:hypothetical protein|nr:hypothetical protein [Burkholderiales bacterium]
MSASLTGIWNMALSHTGGRANISDNNEQSFEADQCRLFYPIALKEALSFFAWTFATSRERLAPLASRETFNWRFVYASPASSLLVLSVGDETAATWDATAPYELMSGSDGTSLLYTDVENAVAFYVRGEVSTALFSPSFVSALALLLASHLAGSLIKGQSSLGVKKAMYEMYMVAVRNAAAIDANQRSFRPDFAPSGIAARDL